MDGFLKTGAICGGTPFNDFFKLLFPNPFLVGSLLSSPRARRGVASGVLELPKVLATEI